MLRTEDALYGKISDASLGCLEDFEPEGLECSPGNILVVTVPEKTVTDGGIELPEIAREKSCVGRVAAVPGKMIEMYCEDMEKGCPPVPMGASFQSDKKCPVKPGYWVIFRQHAGTPVPFGKRTDLLLLQYEEGPASDILGWFQNHPSESRNKALTELEDPAKEEVEDHQRALLI